MVKISYNVNSLNYNSEITINNINYIENELFNGNDISHTKKNKNIKAYTQKNKLIMKNKILNVMSF
jgi:predicted RNase H-like nuclease (RuvC/YqgF family)